MPFIIRILPILFLFYNLDIYARILHVGNSYTYSTPRALQSVVAAGDTVIIHAGIYTGTFFLSDFKGTASNPILITSAVGENVIFQGGTESFHFSDISYIILQNLVIEKQTGNGMNIDDAGTVESPSHHITIRNCIFRNINASGNNDLLKLSGVDDFIIENSIFENGSTGGSGIDMVGCHRGRFIKNKFVRQGSNSIQIKGGSKDILITQNEFTDGGARALNIGGSTGLEFFRPLNATYEASTVKVYANVFIGSEAPIAFVGAVDCAVYQNTFIRPGKWAMRILQETVNPARFEPSGRDSVYNNIFFITNAVSTEVNIGSNTAPTSFYFSNNLWYKESQASWAGPVLPTKDANQIVANPLLDLSTYKLSTQSPAIKKGKSYATTLFDYYNKPFLSIPSIGAVEIESTVGIQTVHPLLQKIKLYPSLANRTLNIESPVSAEYKIIDTRGIIMQIGSLQKGLNQIDIQYFIQGIYFFQILLNKKVASIQNYNNESIKVNVSTYPTVGYIAKLYMDKGIVNKKFVVVK